MWPQPTETQELLERAGDGDDEAVNELFARHRAALRKMISFQMDRALAQRLDASDIVQDVMVEASRRLATYIQNPAMPFHLWLRQLAKDHIIAAHRRHRVAAKRSVDRERRLNAPAFSDSSSVELSAQIAANGLTPAAEAMRRELSQRFLNALDELPAADREIIIMRHFEQLTNQEVAGDLGLTEPAAGMRYLRAIRKLRGVLGDEDLGDEKSHDG